MKWYEARKGTVVRIKDGHWKSHFAGMRGTVQKCWGNSEHAAVDVLLEDGHLEIFWLPDLSVADEDIAIQSLRLVGRESADGDDGFKLPFGYYLELDEDSLILRRADGSDVAVFDAMGQDLFDVELTVWEDADQLSDYLPISTTNLVPLPGVKVMWERRIEGTRYPCHIPNSDYGKLFLPYISTEWPEWCNGIAP